MVLDVPELPGLHVHIFGGVACEGSMTVPTISAYTRWNCLATTYARKSSSTPILTVRFSFQRVFCPGSVRSG